MPTVITDPAQVTTDWLTEVLSAGGTLAEGRVVAVEFEERMPGRSLILPLTVHYSQPTTTAPDYLILKLSPDNDQDQLEVDFYRATLSIRDLPIIRCFHSAYADGRFHILMEDLRATHTPHPPSFLPPTIANAERITDALAQLHTYWWDTPRLGSAIGRLPSEDSIQRSALESVNLLPGFFDFLGDRLSDRRRHILEKVSECLPALRRRLFSGSLTLVHADLHAGNFLYPRDPQQDNIRLIDWKSWSIAPGVSDMANLMAVYWTQERRQQLQDDLLHRYHDALLKHGITGYRWETCWQDYRLAVVDDLFFPIWQWSVGTPDFIWWHNFDRLMLAYHDLDCDDLL